MRRLVRRASPLRPRPGPPPCTSPRAGRPMPDAIGPPVLIDQRPCLTPPPDLSVTDSRAQQLPPSDHALRLARDLGRVLPQASCPLHPLSRLDRTAPGFAPLGRAGEEAREDVFGALDVVADRGCTAPFESCLPSSFTSLRCWEFEWVSTLSGWAIRVINSLIRPWTSVISVTQPRRVRRLGHPDVEADVRAAIDLEVARPTSPSARPAR